MPHGYYTVEQWKSARRGWVPILHLDAYQSLTKAARQLERRGKPGLFPGRANAAVCLGRNGEGKVAAARFACVFAQEPGGDGEDF